MKAWQLVSENTGIVQETHEKDKDSGRPEMDTIFLVYMYMPHMMLRVNRKLSWTFHEQIVPYLY